MLINKHNMLAFVILSLSMIPLISAQSCFVDVKDEIISSHIVVETCEDIGTFSLGKFYDGKYSYTYNYPTPWRGTYIAVKVDNREYSNSIYAAGMESLDNYISEIPELAGNTISARWDLPDNIIVQQILEGVDDGAAIHIRVINNDSRHHRVGVRLILDTAIAGRDSVVIYTGDNDRIIYEKTINISDLSRKTLTLQDRVNNPIIVAVVNLQSSIYWERFDEIKVANWKTIRRLESWDYAVDPSGSVELDSSLVLYSHTILEGSESKDVGLQFTGELREKPTCSDEIENQGEADVDCGGPCPPCEVSKKCSTDVDCASGLCEGRVCKESTVTITTTLITVTTSPRTQKGMDMAALVISMMIILFILAVIILIQNRRISSTAGTTIIIFLIIAGLWAIVTLQSIYSIPETTTTTQPAEEIYYLGIHPLGSPSTMLERFAGVEKYLRDETGLNIKLKLYPTSVDVAGQGAVVRDIINGDISFAYLSSVTVVQAHENGPVIPFACAQKEGLPAYYGHIAVRVNSPYEKIEDLKGKPVCSSSASSASGNLMPTAYLLMKGINKTTYFNPFRFLGSDDKAAEAVLAGTMEAAFINEATFDKYNRGGVKLRSIYRHPAVPEYPFCVNTEKVTPEELAKVKVALLTMHETDLDAIKQVEPKYDKWVAVEWEDYLGIKAAIDEVHGPKFYDVGNWTG